MWLLARIAWLVFTAAVVAWMFRPAWTLRRRNLSGRVIPSQSISQILRARARRRTR